MNETANSSYSYRFPMRNVAKRVLGVCGPTRMGEDKGLG